MSRAGTAGVVALTVMFGTTAILVQSAYASESVWRQFEFDGSHSGHNRAESVLSPTNVDELTLAYSVYGMKGSFVTQPVVLGGTGYMGAGHLVVAFDVRTGAHVWAQSTCTGTGLTTMPAIAGGKVWVGDDQGYLSAFDAGSGRRTLCRWIGYLDTPPSTAGGVVYAATATGAVAAFDANSGAEMWKQRLGSRDVFNTPAVAGDSLFLSTREGIGRSGRLYRLYKLRASTGRVIWRQQTKSVPLSPPTIRGDSVYVGGTGLFSFDAGTGALRWHTKGLGIVSAPP